MHIIKQHRIYREDLKANPQLLYIFGDNTVRTGFGGQACEMRGEPNAFGIITKKLPSHTYPVSYFFDRDEYKSIVDNDFRCLRDRIYNGKYKALVIPTDGIGTGLAKLKEYAPKMLEYINNKLKELELYEVY